MNKILEGIRVVECAEFINGPAAASLLAYLGAEVIKIEQPGVGDGMRGPTSWYGISLKLPGGRSAPFEYLNRNKRDVAIDLKKEKGKELLYKLIEKSDVFLTNLRPRAITKLGLDYGTVSRYNPKLIYASSSAFGRKGPDADSGAFDWVIHARSGLMTTCGPGGDEPALATPGLADHMSAWVLSYGIIAALLARERFGIGQEVTTSMLGAVIPLEDWVISLTSLLGAEFGRQERVKASNPIYNWYKCKDGRWLLLGLYEGDRQWPAFCKGTDIPELEKDPRFDDAAKREANCAELVSILDKLFATRTLEEWSTILRAKDLLFSPCQTISDLLSDPNVLENEYIVSVNHPTLGKVKFVGHPIQFSKTPGVVGVIAPEHGQHTEEVLLELGYTWENISELREEGVI